MSTPPKNHRRKWSTMFSSDNLEQFHMTTITTYLFLKKNNGSML